MRAAITKRKAAEAVVPAGRQGLSGHGAPRSDSAETLSDVAYGRLYRMIVELELQPGSLVSEPMLSTMLGIGRTPIREAFQRLIREGLVVAFPHRGLLIADINQRTQLRLLEVRRELDRLQARLCAERANREQRQRFGELASGMRRAAVDQDDAAFMSLDSEFNKLLCAASDNEFAAKSSQAMQGLWARFWNRYYREVGDVPRVAELHAVIADAVARRDASAAAAGSDQLIDYIEEFTRASLDR